MGDVWVRAGRTTPFLGREDRRSREVIGELAIGLKKNIKRHLDLKNHEALLTGTNSSSQDRI